MAKGTIATLLLAGQLSVDAIKAPLSKCSTCGRDVTPAEGPLLVDSDIRCSNPAAELIVFCRSCAERVALGIINVLTGSAWGIPLSKEGRALLEAQQAVAEAASSLPDEIAASGVERAGDVAQIVRDSLSRPLKVWREKSAAFVASFARPPVSTISETPLFGNPSLYRYPIKRSDREQLRDDSFTLMTLTNVPRFMRHLRNSESVEAFIKSCKPQSLGMVGAIGFPDDAKMSARIVYDFHGTPVVICEPERGVYHVYEVPSKDVQNRSDNADS